MWLKILEKLKIEPNLGICVSYQPFLSMLNEIAKSSQLKTTTVMSSFVGSSTTFKVSYHQQKEQMKNQ